MQLLVAEEVEELKRPRVPLPFFSLFRFSFSYASAGGGAVINSGSRRFSWRRQGRWRWMMMAMTGLPVSSPAFFFLSLSLFSFSCSSRFLSFLSLLSLFSSFLLCIYRKKQRERGLLPLSSHGIGVGWQGRLLCNRPRGTSPLSPPVVGHESQLRQMGVFVGVFLMFSEKEGEEKSRGENSSSSSASRVQGKKKTHSAVQNGTVWGFSLSLSLSLLKQWMKQRRFTQYTPFHLKGNDAKNVSESKSVLNFLFV